MGSYILQVILFQLVFLLVYEFLLKKETFFNYNRAYLLITPVLAFLIPLLRIEFLASVVPADTFTVMLPEVIIGNDNVITNNTPSVGSENSSFQVNWFVLLYVAGVVGSIYLFLKKYNSLNRLFRFQKVLEQKNYNIIEIPNSSIACTFYTTIFLGSLLSEEEKEAIILHELIHVQQRHSLDLLFFELLKIVFWFNPLVYLYQAHINGVHEYIADKEVIKKTEKKIYYQQLLNTAFNTQNISFINQFFNHSLIKKRIVMLQKSKSKTIAKFKYLVVLPLLLMMLIVVSCSKKEEASIDSANSVEIANDIITLKVKDLANWTEEEKEKIDVYIADMASGNNYKSLIIKDENKSITIGSSGNIKVGRQNNNDAANADGVDVPFAVIDQVPIYPGCENLSSNQEQKKCMTNKISEFVGANFNTELGKELKLVGLKRVIVQFKIDKNGEIADARARAPHPELEKEALRVINSIPKMIPGQQKGKNVGVMYSLPIAFQVENDKDAEEKN